MNKLPKRQLILIAVMVLVGIVTVRRYLPAISLPTQGRIDGKLKELQSARNDLAVAQKAMEDRTAMLQSMQKLTEPYWVPSVGTRLDQEVNSEFNRLMRLAQISGVSGSQKVDMGREKPGSNLQEITLSMDFKNISMYDLAAFFKVMRTTSNGRKFRWDYCKVSPDNPRTPKGVNVSVRLKVLALNQDAVKFLQQPDATGTAQESAVAGAQRLPRRTSQKGGTHNNQRRSSHGNGNQRRQNR